MRVVIPSYNRPLAIKTPFILDAAGFGDYVILLHSEDQRRLYLKNKNLDPKKLVVTGEPPGISNQRRWILERWAKPGEWFATLDDNVTSFRGVRPDLYNTRDELDVQSKSFDKRVFDYPLSFEKVLARWNNDIYEANHRGAHYVCFATVPNFYFLGKKYRDVGYGISKVALIHHVGVDYDPEVRAMDDYAFTAEHLKRFGRILINNWIIPEAGHYEPGGIGTYRERLPAKLADGEYLMRKYPGLFRYKVKAGCHPKAELQVRFTSLAQVEAWRREIGEISDGPPTTKETAPKATPPAVEKGPKR